MDNKENIKMTENTEYDHDTYQFPEPLMPVLEQCTEMYEIIKHNLFEVDRAWLTEPNRHSLVIDFKTGLVDLITFLSVMSGSANEFPIFVAEKMFEKDPETNYALGFIDTAEKLGIKELISKYNITTEVTKKFDKFTNTLDTILEILPIFGDNFELSMIYYLYSALIASICKLMENNAFSPIIYTGINNYLNTQFKMCRQHMSNRELDQFDNNVFPYLRRIGDKITEVEQAAKEFYGE